MKTSPLNHVVPTATVRVDARIDDFDEALARSSQNDDGKAALRCLEDISGNHQLKGFNLRSPIHHYEI